MMNIQDKRWKSIKLRLSVIRSVHFKWNQHQMSTKVARHSFHLPGIFLFQRKISSCRNINKVVCVLQTYSLLSLSLVSSRPAIYCSVHFFWKAFLVESWTSVKLNFKYRMDYNGVSSIMVFEKYVQQTAKKDKNKNKNKRSCKHVGLICTEQDNIVKTQRHGINVITWHTIRFLLLVSVNYDECVQFYMWFSRNFHYVLINRANVL